MRGLKTKLRYWRENLYLVTHDILMVTETFLDSTVEDAELISPGWSIIRRDRPTYGGGVLVAARPGIEMRRMFELETESGEDLWVSFSISNVTFYVCVIYISPRANDEVYMKWFNTVESLINNFKGIFIITGDLNLNSASLSVNSYFGYFLSVCNMEEKNDVYNLHGGKLDVVLVSERIRSAAVSRLDGPGLVPTPDTYHPPLSITLTIVHKDTASDKINPSNIDSRLDWNFAKGDYELLYSLISETSWQSVLEVDNVDKAVEGFYDILYSIFDICIPRKIRLQFESKRYPVWFTADIIRDLRQKSYYHRRWKQTRDITAYNRFSYLRKDLKLRLATAYDKYRYSIENNIKSQPRAFWQHIANLKLKGGFESNVSYNGQEYEGLDSANAFAEFFASVFLPASPILDSNLAGITETSCSASTISILNISRDDILRSLKCLKPKSSGPDNVPAFILKACKEFVLEPIYHIFNLSLTTCIYPQRWKLTRVTPIPKARNTKEVEHYRPIAILSALPKLMEDILHKTLSKQVKPLLSDSQHGFRAGRSVDTNLITLVDTISANMDAGSQVDVIYFDFKKAFDRVDNDILLNKLSTLGFTPSLLKFFADYLRNRRQYVRHGCFESAEYPTRSGVSQGSILGPLLFILMVNDLESVISHASCLLYADDLKIILPIKSMSDHEKLQTDLEALHRWSVNNKLQFNILKCCVMTFTRSKTPVSYEYRLGSEVISRVNEVKDLGVLFDPKLNFHEHIKKLAADSFKRLGFVIRNAREFKCMFAIELLYVSLVRSKLEASSVIWNPYESTYILLLEKVQKAFLRFLYKKTFGTYPYLYPTKFLLGSLGFNSLEVRRNCTLLLFVFHVLRGENDCPEILSRLFNLFVPDNYTRSRRHKLLAPPVTRTTARRNSPLVRGLVDLNAFLATAPSSDIFADRLDSLMKGCLKFYESVA